MRKPVTAGKIEPRVARVCGWCGRYLSQADRRRGEAGARRSHGICLPCREKHFPDLPDPAA